MIGGRVVSTVTVTINKLLNKLLTIVVNCGIILSKLINKSFNIVSVVISTLLPVVISFINFDRQKVIYARDPVRTQSRIRFDTIVEAASKLRQVTSVKFRTLFINKDSKI